MRLNPGLALLAAGGALCVSASSVTMAATPAKATPDLRGSWKLDAARSDDPQLKMKEAMANAPRGGGPPGMGGGGRPGMGGGPAGMGGGRPPGGGGGRPGGRGGPPGGQPEGTPDGGSTPARAGAMPDAFDLEQSGDTLVIVDRGLRVRLVVVDGRGGEDASSVGGVALASGKWKKDQLRVESTGPRQRTVEETWELVDDGAALRCRTKLELPGQGGSVEWTRVYARARPEAAPREGGSP